MTFLELVNRAIFESGVELDELTALNFASPPDKMQKRFKFFVQDAYKDIQQSRDEWEWRTATLTTTIRPRIKVINGDRPTAPPVDSIFEGDLYNQQITVKGVTLLSGAWATGDAEAILDLDEISTQGFVFVNEVYDEVDPTPANVNVFSIKWWGEFNLQGSLGTGAEIQKNSFYIQPIDSSTRRRLQFVSWEDFQAMSNNQGNLAGEPVAFTETAQGWFDFYPRPSKQYQLWFDYSKPFQPLTGDDDVPDLPTAYHEAILWKAVMYYADFDRQPDVFARAERRYKTLQNVFEFQKLPTLTWSPNVYDSTQF